jgi:sugar phosphate isomerase/epimerase
VLADDILPNVRYLADKVEDIELVLFEVDDEWNNLPTAREIDELASIATSADLTFTVHLPLDLKMGGQDDQLHTSLEKARQVIECTQALEPYAYVLHLDGKDVEDYPLWVEQAARSLELTGVWTGDPTLLAVENLENYPLDFIDPVLDRCPVSRCIDIGHLWLEGHDPVLFLQKHLARGRVVHLHGIGTRDHQSLAHMKTSQLEAVLNALDSFEGVMTIEIFNQADLESSLEALRNAGMEWLLD